MANARYPHSASLSSSHLFSSSKPLPSSSPVLGWLRRVCAWFCPFYTFEKTPAQHASLTSSLTLAQAKPNQRVLLKAVRDVETEMTLLRVGLSLGQTVLVLAKPTGGPVVLQQDGLELALGHMYAAAIDIELL